jgi:hypothetical protein
MPNPTKLFSAGRLNGNDEKKRVVTVGDHALSNPFKRTSSRERAMGPSSSSF